MRLFAGVVAGAVVAGLDARGEIIAAPRVGVLGDAAGRALAPGRRSASRNEPAAERRRGRRGERTGEEARAL